MTKLKVARPPATLGDVRFRPFGITDAERLRRMSERLSKNSLYFRFWSGTPHVPDVYVSALGRLDHWDREAMVALLDDEMIGVAEYVRDRERPWRADLAVLVSDPWQRHGVGHRLVAYLASLAGRRGITGFEADVILENRRALLWIAAGWPTARSSRADGAAHFTLPLPFPPTPPKDRPRP
ncbi:hypothetical protein GCM10023085_09660 [Actinomadura viridis]|uniref:GNAT superfamily N-acetyltransferase n=1 Tax=Actinomadura viridis TaxID=58110 RepID=A0A931DNT8_9ACTN|nr:GNAT family N-acetyltransferase [Actinomadura viridis]MBG6091978.1 GNAT superfamily N-acetyltransferase [Actinomadura viridis]